MSDGILNDEWKKPAKVADLPAAVFMGTHLRTHQRYDKTTYQSYDEDVQYPEGPEPYRYICKCGEHRFEVYTPQSYETRVRCVGCGNDHCVHSG